MNNLHITFLRNFVIQTVITIAILLVYLMTGYEKRVILQAMSHWEEHTCIRFRPMAHTDTHSIFITRGSG